MVKFTMAALVVLGSALLSTPALSQSTQTRHNSPPSMQGLRLIRFLYSA